MSDQQDRIYATVHDRVACFSFDETAVKGYPAMLRRSVSGSTMIGELAAPVITVLSWKQGHSIVAVY